MSEGLREVMLGRMRALRVTIEALSETADELMRSAGLLYDRPVANVLRDRARRRRVKVLEMQSRLTALRQRYATRLQSEA
ncbi:MAG: hypothetical protein MIL41_00090 [Hyphomicrobiales bacterium]|mgnify:CR=1 FL=1|jgi:hypothetical protein